MLHVRRDKGRERRPTDLLDMLAQNTGQQVRLSVAMWLCFTHVCKLLESRLFGRTSIYNRIYILAALL